MRFLYSNYIDFSILVNFTCSKKKIKDFLRAYELCSSLTIRSQSIEIDHAVCMFAVI